MKALLIVGGVLFLLLAFVLFVAAIIVFFVVRNRRAKEAGGVPASPAQQPIPPPRATPVVPAAPAISAAPHVPVVSYASPQVTLAPPQPPPVPPAPPQVVDHDKTVLTDPRLGELFGALHGTSGPLAGRVFPIDAAGFFIGRDRSTSQVVIDSPSISKRHVWVGVRDGVVMAVDQNSTNGTFLNDPNTSITESRLAPDDTLILGGDVARFVYRA